MKIAIIENDSEHASLLKERLQQNEWVVEYFESAMKFGFSDLESYDVIVPYFDLNTIAGRDLINSISAKTSAQFLLMVSNLDDFSEDDVNNKIIAGFVNKSDIDGIVEQLRYIDVKIRINKLMMEDQKNFSKEPEYTIEEHGEILLLGLSQIISDKKKLTSQLEAYKQTKFIVFFKDNFLVTSRNLGDLAFLYKFFKLKGTMVFFDESNKNIELIKSCRLDSLFNIFNDLDSAISFLNKN